jgi:hypothetical protein
LDTRYRSREGAAIFVTALVKLSSLSIGWLFGLVLFFKLEPYSSYIQNF